MRKTAAAILSSLCIDGDINSWPRHRGKGSQSLFPNLSVNFEYYAVPNFSFNFEYYVLPLGGSTVTHFLKTKETKWWGKTAVSVIEILAQLTSVEFLKDLKWHFWFSRLLQWIFKVIFLDSDRSWVPKESIWAWLSISELSSPVKLRWCCWFAFQVPMFRVPLWVLGCLYLVYPKEIKWGGFSLPPRSTVKIINEGTTGNNFSSESKFWF